MKYKYIGAFSLAIIVLTILFFGAPRYYYLNLSDVVQVEIPKGTPTIIIAQKLYDAGLIPSSKLFVFYVKFIAGNEKSLKPGNYEFSEGVSFYSINKKLHSGILEFVEVTIPEGLRRSEIYSLFQEKGLGTLDGFEQAESDSFIKNILAPYAKDFRHLEGFLYPDTYKISKHFSESQILKMMVENFVNKVKLEKLKQNRLGLTPYEILILASIIEKETGNENERGLVASVFTNRLKKGYRLDTDPSVIYGVPNFKGNLTRAMLKQYTEYNTYKIPGLPPTPISNPGVLSIQAAINPPTSDYLYFVAKGDGTSYFSKNLKEHNKAVRRYQINQRAKNYRSY